MFSRDKKDEGASSRRPPGPPELDDPSADGDQPSGGFFNLPTSPSAQSEGSVLFSGMAVAAPEPANVEPMQGSVASGFSFLNAAGGDQPEEEPTEPEAGSSGFAFMASADDSDVHGDDQLDQGGAHADSASISSGFGFMQTEQVEHAERSISPSSSTTSFSFMHEQAAAAHQAPPTASYLDSMSGLQAPQDIQLGATAVPRKVKKKRSTKKVGYAREEAEQELQEDTRAAQQPHVPQAARDMPPEQDTPPPLPPKPTAVAAAQPDEETPPPLPPKNRSAPVAAPNGGSGSMFADMEMVQPVATKAAVIPAHSQAEEVHHEPPKRQPTPDLHEQEVTRRPSTSSTTSSTSTGAKKSSVGGFFSSWFGGKKDDSGESEQMEAPPVQTRSVPAPTAAERPQMTAAHSPPRTAASAHAQHAVEHSPNRLSPVVEERQEQQQTPRQEVHSRTPTSTPSPAPVSASVPVRNAAPTPKHIPEPDVSAVKRSEASARPSSPAASSKPRTPADPIQAVEEEIAALMFDFHQHTTRLCSELKEVHSRQQSLVRETETIQSEQSRFQKALHEKEIEQQRLAEAEEFEQADHLSGVIETLKRQTSSRAESLRSLVQEAAVLDRRREEQMHEQVASLAKVMTTLRALQARHKKLYDKLAKESTDQFSTREQMLAAEESRIEMTRGHIARDEQNFNEERDQIEEVISAQTTAASAAKAELDNRRTVLEDEIDSLRQMLAAKETERDEVLRKLQEEDNKIQVVRTKFDRQLTRLKEREEMINRNKADCAADETTLRTKQHEYDQELEQIETKKRRMLSASEQWLAELALSEQVKSLLAVKTAQTSTGSAQSDAGHEETLLELKASIADAEETVHTLQRRHQNTQQQIETLSDELKQLSEWLPQLEANKKAAAAARKFKEAAAVNQEIKDATARRDEIQAQLGEFSSKTEEILADLEAARTVQDERRGKLLEAQKDADVRRFEVLLARAKQLRKVRSTIDSNQSSRLQMSAAVLLDAELAAADAEGEEIRLKHNLTFDLDDDDEDDEQPEEEASVKLPNAEAGESDENVVVGEETAAETTPETEPKLEPETEQVSEAAVQEARDLHAQLAKLQAALDEAAEAEDYEMAAELDEEISELSNRLTALNVPPELLAEASSSRPEDTDGATQVDSPNSDADAQVETPEVDEEADAQAEEAHEEHTIESAEKHDSITEETLEEEEAVREEPAVEELEEA